MNLSAIKEKLKKNTQWFVKSNVSDEIKALIETQVAFIEMVIESAVKSEEQNINQSNLIKDLQSTIKDLQRQLGMNSSNSSKPPSTDGFKKRTRSLREC